MTDRSRYNEKRQQSMRRERYMKKKGLSVCQGIFFLNKRVYSEA